MSTIEAEQFDRGVRWLERLGIGHLRRELLHQVTGRVLEIGAGTGANLPIYGRSTHITLIDIKPDRLQLARQKSGRADAPATCADAQRLPFAGSAPDIGRSELDLGGQDLDAGGDLDHTTTDLARQEDADGHRQENKEIKYFQGRSAQLLP